jgi:hypothetical protein
MSGKINVRYLIAPPIDAKLFINVLFYKIIEEFKE